MFQINLFCTRCGENLDLKEYAGRLQKEFKASEICVMCGKVLFSSDIDEPAYKKALWEKLNLNK